MRALLVLTLVPPNATCGAGTALAWCANLVRWFDFTANYSDSEFRQFHACLSQRKELPGWRSPARPALLAGEDYPVLVAPSRISPPAYWVLPAWDYVVSNFVRKHGTYDPGELAVFKALVGKGDVVFDAGAHVGSYAVPLASHVGRAGLVHAFEPFRLVYQILMANVALNGISNVHGHQLALGEREEQRSVFGPALDRPSNVGATRVFGQEEPHFGYEQVLQYGGVETVSVASLDSLGLGPVHFMKVDVEGALDAVLHGARRTIAEHRPLMGIEYAVQQAPPILLEWGYRCVLVLPLHSLWVCVPAERFNDYGWLERVRVKNGQLLLDSPFDDPTRPRPRHSAVEKVDAQPAGLRTLQKLGLVL